jgi:hypothetical protein
MVTSYNDYELAMVDLKRCRSSLEHMMTRIEHCNRPVVQSCQDDHGVERQVVANLEKEIETLTDEVLTLEQWNVSSHLALMEVRSRVDILMDTVENLENQTKLLTDEVLGLRKENITLQLALEDLEVRNRTLTTEVSRLEKMNSALELDVRNFQAVNVSNHRVLSMSSRQVDHLLKQVERMRVDVVSCHNESVVCKEKNTRLVNQYTSLQSNLSHCELELKGVRHDVVQAGKESSVCGSKLRSCSFALRQHRSEALRSASGNGSATSSLEYPEYCPVNDSFLCGHLCSLPHGEFILYVLLVIETFVTVSLFCCGCTVCVVRQCRKCSRPVPRTRPVLDSGSSVEMSSMARSGPIYRPRTVSTVVSCEAVPEEEECVAAEVHYEAVPEEDDVGHFA